MYIHAYIYVKGRKEKKKGKKGTELARGYINMPMPRKRWKDGVGQDFVSQRRLNAVYSDSGSFYHRPINL